MLEENSLGLYFNANVDKDSWVKGFAQTILAYLILHFFVRVVEAQASNSERGPTFDSCSSCPLYVSRHIAAIKQITAAFFLILPHFMIQRHVTCYSLFINLFIYLFIYFTWRASQRTNGSVWRQHMRVNQKVSGRYCLKIINIIWDRAVELFFLITTRIFNPATNICEHNEYRQRNKITKNHLFG